MPPKFARKSQDQFHKTVAIIRDVDLNPCCEHGPTILFDRNGSRFFSCSAYRDRKLCPFHCSEDQWEIDKHKLKSESTTPTRKKRKIDTINEEEDVVDATNPKHTHTPSTKSSPKGPKRSHVTSLLPPPTQIDRGEAQYHFTEETVSFFCKLLQDAEISSVVCIGTPSLHEHLKNTPDWKIDSFLLDIDERLIKQFPSTDCARYNMCNHHFFKGPAGHDQTGNKKNYIKFLKNAESLAIITDPPFGAKVELIWNGALKSVKNDFYQGHPESAKCEIFWIFPYFMEGHILNKCPESRLRMSDYKVLYKNHAKFKEKSQGTGNGKLSPVRFFTSMPLSMIKLPSSLYRYCDICDKWVERRNLHCAICQTCPTKDGGDTYNHCNKCQKCVKPTWKHCSSPCGECHLSSSQCGQKVNLSPSSRSLFSNPSQRYPTKAMVKPGSKFKKSNKHKKK